MRKYIPTSRVNPCPVCADTRRRCRHLSDNPDMVLCMTATDANGAPPGWKFLKLTRDGLWGIVRRNLGEIDDASRAQWAEYWRNLRIERLRTEKARHAASLTEGERDKQIRDILGQLPLCSHHHEDLERRGLNSQLIKKGKFKSVEQWQKLDREVSYQLAGVSLGGRSLMTPKSGYLCPVWNPQGQMIAWQLRVDNPAEDAPKYFWASSRTKKRPNGATAHLQNGELPLTFCTPVVQDEHAPKENTPDFSLSYIGLAEGFLKPWIIAQLRNQITIGAAGGNFAGSPETFKRYLTAASLELKKRQGSRVQGAREIVQKGIRSLVNENHLIEVEEEGAQGAGCKGETSSHEKHFSPPLPAPFPPASSLSGTKDLLLWADAGAVANKNVMRQYRRTYELVRSWGYTLRVAWWGQLDKSCLDGDEYTGCFEILTWAQFESLSRNPLSFWDNVTRSLNKIKRLYSPRRGFTRQVRRRVQRSASPTILVYTPDDLPTPEEYKKMGCPKIIYLGDERVSIWQEAVKKGWQHILDKSAPGLGKSYTAGSMSAVEFGVHQLWYLANDHRNPTTLTVETNFVDLVPRHSGFARDTTRLTPGGQPFLVHPNGKGDFATTPGNCHRASTFRALAAKNINHIEESDNPICLSCHLYNACRNNIGSGFGYRKQRYSVLQHSQIRAHPDSLPCPEDYQFGDCGIFWDEASLIMRSRKKIEINISNFNQTAGELAVTAPELFTKLQPIFERLKFLFCGVTLGPEKTGQPWSNCPIDQPSLPGHLQTGQFDHPQRSILESQRVGEGCPVFSRISPAGKFGEGFLWTLGNIQLPTCGRYGYDDTAIHQLLGQPPDDIIDIINQLVRKLAPDLRFLSTGADSVDTSVGTKGERATSRRINKLLRCVAYQEAKQALDAVSLNWLVPLLEVWGGYTRGALHFDKGVLTVHQQDTRHRDVANAAQYNIFLDGTLDVRYLALKLGVVVENVLVVEQLTPSYENLTVIHITDMGVLGRDRRSSMHQRLEFLRSEIEKLSPGVAFLERKSYAKPGDGYHFRDSRGVNRFADALAVASVGIPYPNIGDLAAEYQVLTGKPVVLDNPQLLEEDESVGEFSVSTQLSTGSLVEEDITFEEFVDSCVRSEIIQECGRLRAHLRPDEKLVYYFIGDYDLEFLSEAIPGITLKKIAAVEISPQAGTTKQRAIWLVSRLFSRIFSQDKKPPTQQEISQLAKTEYREMTQGRISQIGKEFGGWSIFSKLITELLSSFLEAKTQNHTQFDEEERWVKDVYLPLLVHGGNIQPVEAIKEVSQLISVYGWQTFRRFIQSVAIDVKTTLLEYLLLIIPQDILKILVDTSYLFHDDSS
jgi:hypothetical protein